jgi:hypothetical protein
MVPRGSWHKADNPTAPAFVRYWGKSGQKCDPLRERGAVEPELLLALVVVAADGYRCRPCTYARYAKLLMGR